jgi:hypothetical protein
MTKIWSLAIELRSQGRQEIALRAKTLYGLAVKPMPRRFGAGGLQLADGGEDGANGLGLVIVNLRTHPRSEAQCRSLRWAIPSGDGR